MYDQENESFLEFIDKDGGALKLIRTLAVACLKCIQNLSERFVRQKSESSS